MKGLYVGLESSFCLATFILLPITYALTTYQIDCCVDLSSIPLPSQTNVFLQYYLDWINELLFGGAAYIMIIKSAFFFIGTCQYIAESVEDMRKAMGELGVDVGVKADRVVSEVKFHAELLK